MSKKQRGLAHFPLLVKRLLSILFSKMNLCILLKVRAHLYIKREVPIPPSRGRGCPYDGTFQMPIHCSTE